MRKLFLAGTHLAMLAIGFALGIYLLPILTAPDGPSAEALAEMAEGAQFEGVFKRELEGSDFLHWGEGRVTLGPSQIVHQGSLAPGPDYKLYLVPEFVETEAAFEAVKDGALRLGDVKTFGGFVLDIPEGTDLEAYSAIVIWCEAFGEFITAARYR